MTPEDFLKTVAHLKLSPAERAVAVIWFETLQDETLACSIADVCRTVSAAGYGQQNSHRIARELNADRRLTKAQGGFRIRVDVRAELDQRFLGFLDSRPVRRSNSVLPTELFAGTRGYIEKVVAQANVSFEDGLHDCCAVMCRRLLETLIIEVYEAKGWANELKGPDGRFKMFAGLLTHIENEKRFNLGRNALEGLKAFKKLGDQSAHDRRYNARADDITRARDGIRVAAEDLLHLAGLTSNNSTAKKVANG